MRTPNIMLSWLLLFAAIPVIAVEVTNLYQAEAPVIEQTADQQATAIQAAFGKMLIKVTGDRQIVTHSAIQQAMSQAQDYLQQYSYRAVQADNDAQEQPVAVLQVRFDADAVNQLLHQHQIPLWGANRPAVLVWLSIEQQGERHFYFADENPDLQTTLYQQAQERGVPLLLPLLDLEDQQTLLIPDLWADFSESIHQASARYAPDAILTGRLREQMGQWSSDWTLYHGEQAITWQANAAAPTHLIATATQQAIDRLAAPFLENNATAKPEQVLLRVKRVETLSDLIRIMSYLHSLDVLASYRLARLEPTIAFFELVPQTSLHGLQQTIAFEQILLPESPSLSNNKQEPQLNYHLGL